MTNNGESRKIAFVYMISSADSAAYMKNCCARLRREACVCGNGMYGNGWHNAIARSYVDPHTITDKVVVQH